MAIKPVKIKKPRSMESFMRSEQIARGKIDARAKEWALKSIDRGCP